jgi:hypothetical protein
MNKTSVKTFFPFTTGVVDTGGGGGMGEKPNHTTVRKPGPLQIIQHSLAGPLNFLEIKI